MMNNKWAWCLLSALMLSFGRYLSGIPMLAALVPMLLISRGYDDSPRSFGKMAGWILFTFLLWNLASGRWQWYSSVGESILFACINILLFGAVFMIYHYVSKRARRSLANVILVCGWIAAEYICLKVGRLSPWLVLGNGFSNDIWAVQWYEFTGVLGGSLWVLISNLMICQAIISKQKSRYAGAAIFTLLPILISLVMFCTYSPERSENEAKIVVTVVENEKKSYLNSCGGYLSLMRLRAVEVRKGVICLSDGEVSCVITSRGDIIKLSGIDETKIPERTDTSDKMTFYAEAGDYIGRLSVFIFVLGVLYYIAYRYKKRSHLVD